MQKVSYTVLVFEGKKGAKKAMQRRCKQIIMAFLLVFVCFGLCSCSLSLESILTDIKNYINGEEGEVIPADFVESRESGEYTYDAYQTYAVLTGYTGEAVHVTVPAKLDGLPVKRIGSLAFYKGTKVESVVLPDGVTALDENAFYYCDALVSVTIPETVTSLGERCFSWCSSLVSVNLPSGVTAIPDFCFNECVSLERVTFAGKIRTVGARAFSDCKAITSLDFGDALLSAGSYAFRGDEALVWVKLPGNCNLNEQAFDGCAETVTVVTPAGSVCALTCERLGIAVTETAPPIPDEPAETSEESEISDIELE